MARNEKLISIRLSVADYRKLEMRAEQKGDTIAGTARGIVASNLADRDIFAAINFLGKTLLEQQRELIEAAVLAVIPEVIRQVGGQADRSPRAQAPIAIAEISEAQAALAAEVAGSWSPADGGGLTNPKPKPRSIFPSEFSDPPRKSP